MNHYSMSIVDTVTTGRGVSAKSGMLEKKKSSGGFENTLAHTVRKRNEGSSQNIRKDDINEKALDQNKLVEQNEPVEQKNTDVKAGQAKPVQMDPKTLWKKDDLVQSDGSVDQKALEYLSQITGISIQAIQKFLDNADLQISPEMNTIVDGESRENVAVTASLGGVTAQQLQNLKNAIMAGKTEKEMDPGDMVSDPENLSTSKAVEGQAAVKQQNITGLSVVRDQTQNFSVSFARSIAAQGREDSPTVLNDLESDAESLGTKSSVLENRFQQPRLQNTLTKMSQPVNTLGKGENAISGEMTDLAKKLKQEMTQMVKKQADNIIQTDTTSKDIRPAMTEIAYHKGQVNISGKPAFLLQDAQSQTDSGMGEKLLNFQGDEGSVENGLDIDTPKDVEQGPDVKKLVKEQSVAAKKQDVQTVVHAALNEISGIKDNDISSSVKNVPNQQLHVDRDNLVKQVMDSAKVLLTEDKAEMVMHLKPESLGKLSLSIVTERGIVVAKFAAESMQVKQIIEANLPQLKDALEQQGINVQGFSVSVGDQTAGRNQYAQANTTRRKKLPEAEETLTVASSGYFQSSEAADPLKIPGSSVNFSA